MKITLFGIPLSPYVRKVRATLAYKNIPYEEVFVIPSSPDQPEEFKANSPLGKIPLLKIDDRYLSDSSVICAWLEREFPEKPLLPQDNFDAAQALWFEEYAGSVMTTAMAAHLFAEVVLAKAVFNREPIQSDIDKALNVELPAIFDYLEPRIQGHTLLASGFSMADIAVGAISTAMLHSGHSVDPKTWPNTARYLSGLLEGELFSGLIAEEKQLLASFGIG
ncbi:glutathione S-transferase [Litorivivens lipolytica]|uniref:Glutathione S-transferase n=1 Tax=Litorivivens lipolytica TaxID=1524264 RepID=A0A7W4W7I7_9GAMM|nr:glutathione S-transferase family protein [Litorivivens lipolytica]MBB3048750.1 glutathione S-transferase [Litorivivens lipolytica]